MMDLKALWSARSQWFSSAGREQHIKDYMILTNQLVWKRHASFLTVAALAAFYYDPVLAAACYTLIALTEVLDERLGRESAAWDGTDSSVGDSILRRIGRNTVLSATAISIFVISLALQQTSGGHFTPLFFLFSASLFAAMYNSQMMSILFLRLSIYGVAFLVIAFLDIIRFFPPLDSHVWLDFFTIMLVLYFLADISLKFYQNYQKQLEQLKLIREENERTKAAYEVKSQFLSTVSHELRTPLTSLKASLDLVNKGALGEVPEHLKRAIGIAAKNGETLAVLIDDLLDLQKIEAGEMKFRFKPVNVNDLVTEAVETTADFAAKLGIQVTITPCAEDGRINGDRSRLIQVMNNLLSNALKFSEAGSTVNVRVETLGSRIRVSVEDTGVGIPEGAKERVFGKFTQVDSSDIRKVGGTGLGLNIAKQIVERHDASIDYVSELGVGTTFFLDFDRLEDTQHESASLQATAKVA
ncbi:HAMP domain-containing histidine kinase [Maritalea mobilis]|uniref:sensor histidine kinase n=1 Tax=Maritalea mobilis TaxID=483324 RepID=UPI001C98D3B5|nr:ATP-binding protein [Maritalea mobilis]MBY6201411.1 HAMP domain-containing histidine kinase [Maritalea mobilis]